MTTWEIVASVKALKWWIKHWIYTMFYATVRSGWEKSTKRTKRFFLVDFSRICKCTPSHRALFTWRNTISARHNETNHANMWLIEKYTYLELDGSFCKRAGKEIIHFYECGSSRSVRVFLVLSILYASWCCFVGVNDIGIARKF